MSSVFVHAHEWGDRVYVRATALVSGEVNSRLLVATSLPLWGPTDPLDILEEAVIAILRKLDRQGFRPEDAPF